MTIISNPTSTTPTPMHRMPHYFQGRPNTRFLERYGLMSSARERPRQ